MNKKLYQKYGYLNQEEINEAFLDECGRGNIKILEYLLHSKDLKYNAKKFNRFGAVLDAVGNGHIDVVKYLVENTYIKDDYKPYVQNKHVLDAIRHREDIDMIKYLIFELNIDKTEFMQSFLDNSTTDYHKTVAKLYETRDLSARLKEELGSDTISKTDSKKPKL